MLILDVFLFFSSCLCARKTCQQDNSGNDRVKLALDIGFENERKATKDWSEDDVEAVIGKRER